MKENLKISVIVPCYNQAQYLNATLDSVLKQSYTHWECIIVNDGSPDHTEQIAQNWLKKDERFSYVSKKNGGLSSARNAGIEQASGKWILPLDSDDLLAPDYLKHGVEAIKSGDNLGVIYAKLMLFGAVNKKGTLMPYSFERLLHENLIYCTAFFTKEDWERVGGYDTNLTQGWEDWEFWINLLGNTGKEVRLLDYIGFHYRIKEESMITNLVGNKEKELVINTYVMKKHLDLYIKHLGSYPDLLTRIQVLEQELAYAQKSWIRKQMERMKALTIKIKRRISK